MWVTGILAVVIGLWFLAFSIDTTLVAEGEVSRNVRLGKYNVGGKNESALGQILEQIEKEEGDRLIRLVLPDGSRIIATLKDVGIRVDMDATRDEVLLKGKDGSVAGRLFSWSTSISSPRKVSIIYKSTDMIDDLTLSLPITIKEPVSAGFITNSGQPLVLEPEVLGEAIDRASVTTAALRLLVAGLPSREVPTLNLPTSPLSPEIRNRTMREEIQRVNELTAVGIDTILDNDIRHLEAGSYRESLSISIDAETQTINTELDSEILIEKIRLLYADFSKSVSRAESIEEEFDIVEVGIEGEARRCCQDPSQAQLEELLAGEKLLKLDFRTVLASESIREFRTLEINRRISEFQTNYAPGQARATNIQTAAEAIRGAIIRPGEIWSMNQHIGPRTLSKGYLSVPALYIDRVRNEVGGGISQLATTLFNAAFYAGLEFREHQSHSIYFDRYPYGVEAAISWPDPDLKIFNPTPYGILIWTTNTEDSVRVSLYSTPYYQAIDLDRTTVVYEDQCQDVTTSRVRVTPEGNAITDRFKAYYQPEAGLNCHLDPIENQVLDLAGNE